MLETLLKMEIHEILRTKSYAITRVPNGWIYREYGNNKTPVFVPEKI